MNFVYGAVSTDDMMDGPERTETRALWWWALRTVTARTALGRAGGSRTVDDAMLAHVLERTGAVLVGRRTADALRSGRHVWWPDTLPIIVVARAHHPAAPASFEFVTTGLPTALALATAHATPRDVWIMGGATLIASCLRADVVDELLFSQVPRALPGGLPFPRQPHRTPYAVGVVSSPIPGRATHVRHDLRPRRS